jgi:uncharacterized protein involved in response to NO
MRHALLTQGFRPFFLFVGLWAMLALAGWIGMLEGVVSLPSRFSPLAWHVHEMLFGVILAAIAGFLLTAVPNWTGRLPSAGARLAILALCWLIGRVDMAVSDRLPFALSVAGDLLFNLALIAVMAREIVAGRNWRNLVTLAPLAVLLAANLLMHLEEHGQALPPGIGWRLAIGANCFLIALIGGRIVPSFTRNWLRNHGHAALPMERKWLSAAAIATLVVSMIAWVAAPDAQAVGLLLVVAALLHGARLAQWKGLAARREALLFVLHIGYGWLVAGLLLLGLTILAPDLPRAAAIHALTAGAMTTMILAVMTRASRGHTGRALTAGVATRHVFLFVTMAAGLRVVAAFGTPWTHILLLAAAAFWVGAFGLFLVAYAPILWLPRPESPPADHPGRG